MYIFNTLIVDYNDPILKEIPRLKILRVIKIHFIKYWKDIAYQLIPHEDIELIDNSGKDIEEKCFDMLIKWIDIKPRATYADLIEALKCYNLNKVILKIVEYLMSQTPTIAQFRVSWFGSTDV